MRGYILPNEVIDWSHCISTIESERNRHFALEDIVMGPSRKVDAHLIVPTCFSIGLTKAREERMIQIIRNGATTAGGRFDEKRGLVLYTQDFITRSCAFCNAPLPPDEKRPYQMGVRIINSGSAYDMLLCLFCRRCQTRPFFTLALVDETCYVVLSEAISIGIGNNTENDQAENPMTRFHAHLSDVNKRSYSTILSMMINRNGDEYASICYHCNKKSHVPPAQDTKNFVHCAECGVIAFCIDCNEKYGRVYHKATCDEMRKGLVFHMDAARCVNEDGRVVKVKEEP